MALFMEERMYRKLRPMGSLSAPAADLPRSIRPQDDHAHQESHARYQDSFQGVGERRLNS